MKDQQKSVKFVREFRFRTRLEKYNKKKKILTKTHFYSFLSRSGRNQHWFFIAENGFSHVSQVNLTCFFKVYFWTFFSCEIVEILLFSRIFSNSSQFDELFQSLFFESLFFVEFQIYLTSFFFFKVRLWTESFSWNPWIFLDFLWKFKSIWRVFLFWKIKIAASQIQVTLMSFYKFLFRLIFLVFADIFSQIQVNLTSLFEVYFP